MGRLIEDPSLRNRTRVFQDRQDAGRLLAVRLEGNVPSDSIVLAIPAGGVPVACEIAKHLSLPLDLMIVRKIQFPHNPEAGFGAVGPEGEIVLNERLVNSFALSEIIIGQQVEKTRKVIEQRNRIFRQNRPLPDLKGKTVILVDDGLASGYAMTAAAHLAKKKEAGMIIVAVPTAPESTINNLMTLIDELYCLNVRTRYPFAVAEAYQLWYDVGDEEIISILSKAPTSFLSQN